MEELKASKLREHIIEVWGQPSPELRTFDALVIEMGMGIISNAKNYAITCHTSTNHFYDNTKPYSLHLGMVEGYGRKYGLKYFDIFTLPYILGACWTHDTLEDTRQTLNDCKKACGETIAEITYALTNEKGRNRAERGNEKYYQGIRETEGAVFVKLCDRLANVKYSLDNGSSMFGKYKKENDKFKERLYDEKYKAMFDELDAMFVPNPLMASFD